MGSCYLERVKRTLDEWLEIDSKSGQRGISHRGKVLRALRPKELNSLKPLAKGLPESRVPGIGRRT
jgi:hypothetical protein